MRKIRHGELETCIADPVEWVARKLTPKGFIRPGYDRVTKQAIYKYHSTGSLAISRQHLARLLSSYKLTSHVRAEQCEDRLEQYVAWFEAEQPVVAKCKHNIILDIGNDWFISGEVSRIDYLGAGCDYRGILLESSSEVWIGDLRMPLLQRALANSFQRREEEFCVGLQGLDGVVFDVKSFSSAEIDDAMVAVRGVAETLAEVWAEQQDSLGNVLPI